MPQPQPDPPSPEEAAEIANAAWRQDDDWGTFVWLTLVPGARRGELLALTWQDVDFIAGVLTIRRSLVQHNGKTIVKDTKTHQMRRISLDEATVEILDAHQKRCASRCTEIDTTLRDEAYVFSYSPDNQHPCNPSAITHRYARMTTKLGLRTHLHALRHYSATELLAAGVDLRTVAGRLGHGGRIHHPQGLRRLGCWCRQESRPAHRVQLATAAARRARPCVLGDCGVRVGILIRDHIT